MFWRTLVFFALRLLQSLDFFFFFQAEDGIRDTSVTGVQTCALPILGSAVSAVQKAVSGLHLPPTIRIDYGGTYKEEQKSFRDLIFVLMLAIVLVFIVLLFEFRTFAAPLRSEERRVGYVCRLCSELMV